MADGFGRHIEHTPGIDGIEALAEHKQQRQALRRRKVLEKCRSGGVEPMAPRRAEERGEARIARFRAGVLASLLEPEPVDLGEGPAVERGAALIAMLFGEHAPERPAEKASAGAPVASEKIGEAHEPRQHRNEPGSDRLVEIFRLHFSVPPPFGCVLATSGNTPRESKG